MTPPDPTPTPWAITRRARKPHAPSSPMKADRARILERHLRRIVEASEATLCPESTLFLYHDWLKAEQELQAAITAAKEELNK